MSKLSDISSNATLREYAQGAAQGATSSIADFLAPTVSVSTPTGHYKRYNQEDRFRIPDTRRALGGRATEVGFSASDATYNCSPHGLDLPIDVMELSDDGAMDMMMEGADMLADIAALAHEKTVIDIALATAGAGTALGVGSSDDIVAQLDAVILTVLKAAKYGALMDIGILFGAGAWAKIRNHASVKSRVVSGNTRTFSTVGINDVSDLFIGNPKGAIAFMVADTSGKGKAPSDSFLLDGDVLVFARRENPTRLDPSFMKTFRLRNQWMVPGSYTRDDGRVEVAKYDWSEDVQATNSAAVVRKTVSL